ncbi:MAG TPA: response regulator transcription factor [Mycobacteriales bacterium]|nr:response regulator transcription factor [Mycobacteriales bacterium]
MTEPDAPEIGVVIIDDHRMFAESVGRLLDLEEGMTVLGNAPTAAEGIALVQRVRPTVVLVDYQLPDRDGVEVTTAIKARDPDVMVVMLTGSADDRVLLAAIEAGCSGFLTKDRASGEVAEAVRSAAAGEALISPGMLARLLPRLSPQHRDTGVELTAREREVLEHMALGLSNKAIAERLFLSVNTVRNYVASTLMKLDAHSKLEAVAAAVREGIIAYPNRT